MELPINTIVCGDCLEVMKDWPDNCVDLVVTSPPYDNLRDYKGYSFDFKRIAAQLLRILKKGGVVVWVVNDATVNGSETGTSFRQALYFKQIGFNLHDTMIWTKEGGGAVGSNKCYVQNFEYMFVFSKDNIVTYNLLADVPNLSAGKNKSGVGRRKVTGEHKIEKRDKCAQFKRRNNHWYIPPEKGKHPAVFPKQLANDHILSWSNKTDLILDPFCGSGTTCVAAKMLGRNYIGIDISEEYCKIARERIKAVETGVPVKERRQGQAGLFE